MFRKVCEFFGFDRLNKHQEEALRFAFEFWAVLVSESRLVSVAWRSTVGQ